jgi:putative DNA primase/helicase
MQPIANSPVPPVLPGPLDPADAYDPAPSFACLPPRQIPWLWKDRFPLGQLSLLVSHPGLGKSLLTVDMAARISTGAPWPDNAPSTRGSVLFISREEDPHEVIRPRLDAHAADINKIHLLHETYQEAKSCPLPGLFFNLRRTRPLDEALQKLPDCRLVIIDPVSAFTDTADPRNDVQVRDLLGPLLHFAQRHGTAILLLHHLSKRLSRYADQSIIGSSSFASICRNVWHLLPDPADVARDGNRRLLVPGKSNFARRAPALAFTVTSDPTTGAARILWEKNPLDFNANQVLNRTASAPGPEPVSRAAAQAWLTDYLKSGPQSVLNIQLESNRAGVAWRTLQRAADYLSIIRRRSPDKNWTWQLPLPA